MRSFIKPPPGMALAQVDFGAEEIGIAAALSGDPVLQADYLSGDPYRQFAAAALGILNPTEQQRQIYKATVLGRIYGLGVASLARNLGISKAQAQRIIDQMNARYPVLNAWLQRVTTKAAHCRSDRLHARLVTDSDRAPGRGAHVSELSDAGQRRRVDAPRDRARQRQLRLIGCAHDSFLIEDTIDRIEESAAELQEIMRQASRDLLGGFELRADCKPDDIVRYPDRFIDKRELEDGMRHWNWLMTLIAGEDDEQFTNCRHGDANNRDPL